MFNLKRKVKKDFENKTDVNFSFDVSKLPELDNHKKSRASRYIVAISLACVVVLCVILIPVFAGGVQILDSFQAYKSNYSLNEMKLIESSSFKKLNEVTYPSSEYQKYSISANYRDAVLDFTSKIYNKVDKARDDFSFSPLGLYSNLDIVSLASDDALVGQEFDSLLGDRDMRRSNYRSMYQSDFFANDYGTMQMYNGVFQSKEYDYNQNFVDDLSRFYTESYQIDFSNENDIDKVLSWVDQKVDSQNFMNKEDLQIDEDSAILFLSTLYFNNEWNSKFSTSQSYEDSFMLDDGSTIETTFMTHVYRGDIHINDDFVSVFDYYQNGFKINYIVPKSLDGGDIISLTDENVIFDKSINMDDAIIDLSVPRFKSSCMIDFTDVLKELGLVKVFEEDSQALNHAFDNLGSDYSAYLSYTKQKNEVSFDEDGSEVKSVTFSMGNMTTTSKPDDQNIYSVKLNQKFIYVIYDSNDLPVYVGIVNNPKK